MTIVGNYKIQWKVLKYFTWALASIITLHEAQFLSDFDISVSASADLLRGENIYAIRYHEWFHYYYSIFFAFLISPLTSLPLYWRNLIWLLLNLAFTYRIWRILRSYLPLQRLSDKQHLIFSMLSLALIFTLWRKNMQTTQMTIFILYLSLEGLQWISKKRNWLGSSLLALGINIKLLPMVLMPYLVFRRNFAAFFVVIIVLSLLYALPYAFLSTEYYNTLLSQWWTLINPTGRQHLLDVDEESFHSLTTLLSTLLVKENSSTSAILLRRHILDLDVSAVAFIINLTRLILVLSVLYVLRGKPFKSNSDPIQSLYEISYILLLIPLIFPHQQHYAFFLAFPAIVYMCYYVIANSKKTGMLAIKISLAIIFLVFNSYVIAEGLRLYFEHFKILTYAALLLLIHLLLCKPSSMITPPDHKSGISPLH